MGNVVMPKNSADIDVLIPILEYYYKNRSWVDNANYIEYIKNYLLDKGIDIKEREPQHYTKRMQLLSYFGFIEWKNIEDSQSARRITKSGTKFYEAVVAKNNLLITESIIKSLENTTFGRANMGAPSSESDIEAPCLCIRMILDLKYITKVEFAFALYKLQDQGFTYSTVLQKIKDERNNSSNLQLPDEANKYTDWKPINFLERFNILITDDSKTFINPEIKKQYENRLKNLKVYNIDRDINFSYHLLSKNIDHPHNRIIFGAPGTGKSHKLNLEAKDEFGEIFDRVTFHPNYSYAQFVGTYKPVSEETEDGKNEISYRYVPGPFMRVYVNAVNNPKKNYLLLIEEINRANVAAVFGDIFQLLDRNADGVSEYPIAASEDIKKYLLSKGISCDELKIPSNMYIWATMNSADQGVMPMDAAFKRRWDFEYLGIDEGEFDIKIPIPNGVGEDKKVNDWKNVNWNELRTAINNTLKKIPGVNEDKLLGPFFIGNRDKIEKLIEKKEEFNKLFKSKVLMYLFEDVVKMNPGDLFDIQEGENIHYSDICKKFDEQGLKVFVKSVSDNVHEVKTGENN